MYGNYENCKKTNKLFFNSQDEIMQVHTYFVYDYIERFIKTRNFGKQIYFLCGKDDSIILTYSTTIFTEWYWLKSLLFMRWQLVWLWLLRLSFCLVYIWILDNCKLPKINFLGFNMTEKKYSDMIFFQLSYMNTNNTYSM